MTLPLLDLKPCPFCGSPGLGVVEHGGIAVSLVSPRQSFGCVKCQVRRHTAEAWNTRTPDPEAAATIEKLAEALKETDQLLAKILHRSAVVPSHEIQCVRGRACQALAEASLLKGQSQ